MVRTESPTSAHPGDTALIDASGRLVGWIGGSCSEPLVRREALAAIADGLPRLVRIRPDAEAAEVRGPGEVSVATTCPSGGALDIFIDPQLPPPLLVAVGDSPAAQTLLQLGRTVGFRTCAVRRHGEAVGAEPSPGAASGPGGQLAPDQQLELTGLARLQDRLDVWVVVATMGHDDEDALAAALALPHADIALVASERRAQAVLENLRQRGVSEAELARVRSPAGGYRGGTQAEIALHALAEVVARRRDRLVRVQAAPFDPAAPGSSGSDQLEFRPPQPAGFAVDPVCGMTVDISTASRSLEHDGRTYHFCCAGCAQSFAADPSRYLGAAAG